MNSHLAGPEKVGKTLDSPVEEALTGLLVFLACWISLLVTFDDHIFLHLKRYIITDQGLDTLRLTETWIKQNEYVALNEAYS